MYIIFKYSEGPSIGYISNKEEAEEYAKLTNCYIEELQEIKRSDWPEKVKFIQAIFRANTQNADVPLYDFNEIDVLDSEINMYNDELFYSHYMVRKHYFNCSKDEAEKDFRAIIEDPHNGYTIVKNIHKWGYVAKKSELQSLVKKDVDGVECWAKLEEWAEKEKPKSTTTGLFTSGGYITTGNTLSIGAPTTNYRVYNTYTNATSADTGWFRPRDIYINTEARNEIINWPAAQPIGTVISAPTNNEYVTVQLTPGTTNTNT